MRSLWYLAPLVLLACSLGLPQGQADEVARRVADVGHPLAQYRGADVVGGSAMGCGGAPGSGSTVELDVTYKSPLSAQEDVMRVRVRVLSIDPCEARVEVVSDSGPPPIFLDNATAAEALGREVCAALLP